MHSDLIVLRAVGTRRFFGSQQQNELNPLVHLVPRFVGVSLAKARYHRHPHNYPHTVHLSVLRTPPSSDAFLMVCFWPNLKTIHRPKLNSSPLFDGFCG